MYSEKHTTTHITAAESFMGKVPSVAPVAKMGPNGIIQTFNAIASQFGENAAQQALLTAGLQKYIAERPHEMVDEREFHRLVHSVCEHFDEDARNAILLNAGERTAHYLLQARIPKLFQLLLKGLPTRWAAKLLLWSIAKHAWTFAGSGEFSYQVHSGIEATILVRESTHYEVALFFGGALQTLFQTLFKDPTDFNIQVVPSNQALLCRYSAQIITHHSNLEQQCA
ncbi:MAG: bacteriochlorophyll 4-vinyl reductase [Candidatus Thermochlorobacter sp.]